MDGAASPTDLASKLIRTDGMGAQLMEVGCSMNPAKLSRVFDAAARNGVLLTANGTTDDHDGVDWLSGRRWLTRVWSPSRRQGDLCRSLEAGRAWFYDPLHWDGALNLVVAGMHMGGVRFTKKRVVNVAVRATELPRGAIVQIVVGACDFAGARQPTPINRVRTLRRGQFRTGVLARTRQPGARLLRTSGGPTIHRRRDRILQPRLGAAASIDVTTCTCRRFDVEQCRCVVA